MKNNKKKIRTIGVVIIVILLLIPLSYFGIKTAYNYLNPTKISEYEESVNAITQIPQEERKEQLNQIVKDSEINVQYSPSAVFEGKTSVSFNVKNIENNHDDIQFIIFDENGDEIYTSKLIQRGYECNKIQLEKALSKGTHECFISIFYANKGGNVSAKFPISIQVR